MYVDYVSNVEINQQFINKHNHPVPIKKKLHPEVRSKVKAMIEHRVKPSVIHKNLVLEADKQGTDISPKNVSTRNNLRQMTYRYRHKDMPSYNAFFNMVAMHPQFVYTCNIHQKIHIVCIDPDAVNLLIKDGRTVFMDGSFDIIERELYLTSLLVKPANAQYAIGVAWLISEEQTTGAYEQFFSILLEQTQRQWWPEFILADFEQALHNACAMSFPRVNILGDSFHFMYDNQKFLRQHNGTELVPIATPLLQDL